MEILDPQKMRHLSQDARMVMVSAMQAFDLPPSHRHGDTVTVREIPPGAQERHPAGPLPDTHHSYEFGFPPSRGTVTSMTVGSEPVRWDLAAIADEVAGTYLEAGKLMVPRSALEGLLADPS